MVVLSVFLSCFLWWFAESKPTFTEPLKDLTVPEEESVTLECELSKPDQKVKWLKDGKEIKPDRKKGITTKSEGRRHSLTIPRCVSDDSAEYTAKCGDQETKAQLTVEGTDIFHCLLLFYFLVVLW